MSKRVVSYIICLLLSVTFLAGCSNTKSEPVDPDKLKTYVADYEAAYIKDSGKLDEASVADYLKDLSVKVMSTREYQVADVATFGNTLRFSFTDNTEYCYTPDGFEAYDFTKESDDVSDTEGSDTESDEASGNLTGVIIDSDIPNPGLSVSSETGTIGGSAIKIDPGSGSDEKDKSMYEDLGDEIDPNDYSDEELKELRRRIAESNGSVVDDSETEADEEVTETESNK